MMALCVKQELLISATEVNNRKCGGAVSIEQDGIDIWQGPHHIHRGGVNWTAVHCKTKHGSCFFGTISTAPTHFVCLAGLSLPIRVS